MAGYTLALQTALDACDALAETIDIDNGPQLKKLVDAAVGTKFSFRYLSQVADFFVPFTVAWEGELLCWLTCLPQYSPLWHAQLSPCLLYTSDAADE